MNKAIHITHEASKKIGGIGSVLSGMCTSETYLSYFDRTLFYGPLFDDKPNLQYDVSLATNRLGGDAEVLFSSLDQIKGSKYDILFSNLIKKYQIEIVYGKKTLFDEIHPDKKNKIEIILVGIKSINTELLNLFKFKLWETFQFSCQDYEKDWDFEQYLRIAVPFGDICDAVLEKENSMGDKTAENKGQNIYFSHEYMGVASCLSIYLKNQNTDTPNIAGRDKNKEKIYFHAHEISTARAITEKIPGHDITFYRCIEKDLANGVSMEDRFGSQKQSSRSELVKLTVYFDGTFAVGDWVKKEYKYLIPNAETGKIHICYNGTPDPNYSFAEKLKSRKKLQTYCDTLYNFIPDVIMTHVTRLVISKGLWRDVSLLEALDKKFTSNKIKGFCIILSSLIGNGRDSHEITQMEKNYGWPVLHKQGYPDLLGDENEIYHSIQYFNARSRSIKMVFINQFGFSPERVGHRLPANTSFADLRLGSDSEFGMSIYEPFGIAQIETIPFGGVAILTKACGSAFLLQKAFKNEKIKPFYIFDFADSPDRNINTGVHVNDVDAMSLSSEERVKIEKNIILKNIDKVYKILPKTDAERKIIFDICRKHTGKLSWNNVLKTMPFLK